MAYQWTNFLFGIKTRLINSQHEYSKYKNIEILLIDDLFKGGITEADIRIAFEIINHRYINKLPMMVSSELTIKEILSKDEAVGSRIYEMAKGFICEVKGNGTENNYRLRNNK